MWLGTSNQSSLFQGNIVTLLHYYILLKPLWHVLQVSLSLFLSFSQYMCRHRKKRRCFVLDSNLGSPDASYRRIQWAMMAHKCNYYLAILSAMRNLIASYSKWDIWGILWWANSFHFRLDCIIYISKISKLLIETVQSSQNKMPLKFTYCCTGSVNLQIFSVTRFGKILPLRQNVECCLAKFLG